MNNPQVLLLLLLGLGATVHASIFSHLGHELHKHEGDLKKIDVGKLIGGKNLKSVNAYGVSWSNCGDPSSDVIKINSLTIGPDPLHLPGAIQASMDVVASRNVTNPVSVDLDIKVKKKWFGWIKVPCFEHKGSCTYDDVCPHVSHDCPPAFQKYGIPCICPFKEGHYVLPLTSIEVDKVKIPSFMKNGEYKIRARASIPGAQLLCVDLQFKLK